MSIHTHPSFGCVFFLRGGSLKYDNITDNDREMIALQLGREARGLLGVAVRCKYGYPQVIVNRPVSIDIADINVFPTLFWLTCPYLRKAVARLESEGFIAHFEERLQEDEEFAKQVEANHDAYAKARLDLIPREVQARLEEDYPERFRVIAHSGIGGSRSREGVKCLHMHLADYLVQKENVIGEEVVKLLDCSLHCDSGSCEKEL